MRELSLAAKPCPSAPTTSPLRRFTLFPSGVAVTSRLPTSGSEPSMERVTVTARLPMVKDRLSPQARSGTLTVCCCELPVLRFWNKNVTEYSALAYCGRGGSIR